MGSGLALERWWHQHESSADTPRAGQEAVGCACSCCRWDPFASNPAHAPVFVTGESSGFQFRRGAEGKSSRFYGIDFLSKQQFVCEFYAVADLLLQELFQMSSLSRLETGKQVCAAIAPNSSPRPEALLPCEVLDMSETLFKYCAGERVTSLWSETWERGGRG